MSGMSLQVTRRGFQLQTGSGKQGVKGDTGGNTMAAGLFADVASLTVPVGTDMIITSGHAAKEQGSAKYRVGATSDPAAAATAYSTNTFNGRPVYLVDEFLTIEKLGARGNGTVDDALALQAGIDFRGAGGGHIYIPPAPNGHWTWKTLPLIPAGLTGVLEIRGLGRPQIKLTSTAKSFAQINRTADYQTFRHIHISDLEIDGDSLTGNQALVFGGFYGGVRAQRVNWDDIVIERIKVVNALTDDAASPASTIYGVAIYSAHPASDEATQTTITNIHLRQIEMDGGNSVAQIAGVDLSIGTSANVWLDQIHTDFIRHTRTGYTPPRFWGSTSIIIGGEGVCGVVRVGGLYGEGAGDNILELDSVLDGIVDNLRGENAFNTLVYINNYHALTDPTQQRIVFNDLYMKPYVGSASGGQGRCIEVGRTNPLGTVRINGGLIDIEADPNFNANRVFDAVSGSLANRTALARLEIFGLKIKWGVNASLAANAFPVALFLNGVASSVLIRGLDVKVSGTLALNAHSFNFRTLQLLGDDIYFDIDGVTLDYAVTGTGDSSGRIVGVDLGRDGSASKCHGLVRGFRAKTTNQFTAAVFGSGCVDATHTVELDAFDTRQCSLVTNSFGLSFGTANDADFVRVKGWKHISSATVGVKTHTLSGSPQVIKNQDGYSRTLSVIDGTVSLIEWSPDGSTYTNVAKSTDKLIPWDHTSSVRITYSVAPTVKSYPAANV